MTIVLLDVGLWLLAAGWIFYAAGRLRDTRSVRTLPALPTGGVPGRPPHVSVVIPARNEERRIGGAVMQVLEQVGVEVELRVVDDRSTDRTAQILDDLARRDPRIRVTRVEELPEGWLGKPHACQVGASKTTGDWLLFLDADVWMKSDTVARAVEAARREGAEHVCLAPGESEATLAARAALLHFWMGMLWAGGRANRDVRGSFIGVGAFNLVRAEAYHAIGGHQPLRLEVIDDLKLGALLRRAGFRSRLFEAALDLTVDWAPTARSLARALEKNLFALFEFSVIRTALAVCGLTLVHGLTLTAPLTLRPAGLAAFAAMLTMVVPARLMSRRAGWGRAAAWISPFMGFLLVAAIVRSARLALGEGGIRWRGTFYPLALLRRGLVRL